MKYFIYLILLLGFATAQAQVVFNPVEKKAEACQQYEEIKGVLSCEGEDCPPLYDSAVYDTAVPLPFQLTAGMACAFACEAGERMCDETLNPDNDGMEKDFFDSAEKGSMSYCARSHDEAPTEEDTKQWYNDEGVKRIEKITTYSSGCEEYIQYIEVCNQEGQECQEIEIYSEEWYAYKREMQMKAYEESCSIATEEDCKSIEAEMGQCMLDVVGTLSEAFCSSSKGNLWRYRKYGVGIGMIRFKKVKAPEILYDENYPPSPVPVSKEAEEGGTTQE